MLMHIIGTYKLSMTSGMIVRTFKGYLNVPCILYSVSIFYFCKRNDYRFKNSYFNKVITLISEYTFAIYLLHFYVMEFVRDHVFIQVLGLGTTSIIYRLVAPIPIIAICIIITFLIRKIPLLNKVLPK